MSTVPAGIAVAAGGESRFFLVAGEPSRYNFACRGIVRGVGVRFFCPGARHGKTFFMRVRAMYTPIAVMADIHGNTLALEAVFRDMRELGISQAYNLGDILYGPLDPAGTCRLLADAELALVHIRGNGDRMVLETGKDVSSTVRYTRGQLCAAQREWLQDLPPFVCDDTLFACHGTPRSDTEYLVECLVPEGVRQRTDEDVAALLAPFTQGLVLCGHSHVPHALRLADGRFVVNPGSVGLPAYADSDPVPHAMEAGTPHARYAVLFLREGQWQAQFRRVCYDHESAAAMALENGRPDWAASLRSGRAGSEWLLRQP